MNGWENGQNQEKPGQWGRYQVPDRVGCFPGVRHHLFRAGCWAGLGHGALGRSQSWRQMREGQRRGERWGSSREKDPEPEKRGGQRQLPWGYIPHSQETPSAASDLRGKVAGDWRPEGIGSQHSVGKLALGHTVQSCWEVKQMENRSQNLEIGLVALLCQSLLPVF